VKIWGEKGKREKGEKGGRANREPCSEKFKVQGSKFKVKSKG
jgi:hypothetical protein